MNEDDEEKLAGIISTIAVGIMFVIAVLLLLSASIWVYDTFL